MCASGGKVSMDSSKIPDNKIEIRIKPHWGSKRAPKRVTGRLAFEAEGREIGIRIEGINAFGYL